MKISAIARKGVLVLLILLAGIFIWLLCIIFQPLEPHYQEPQYEGKKLTDWANEVDQSDFFRMPAYQVHPKQNEQAIAAIRQIGTNALPVTLDLLAAKDSWLKTKIEEWIDQYNYDAVNCNLGLPKDQWRSPFPIRVTPAWEQHYYGANIIWALGSMTKPIVPALIQLLQSPDREIAENAMDALPGVGTNAIPSLIELLNSPDKDVRLRAAIALGDFFKPQMPANKSNGSLIVTGGEDFRSQARAAVPVLLSNLDNRNINLVWRIRVIGALGLIGEDAPVVVPILIHHIQSETNQMDVMIRGDYFAALGNFGTNAMSAVPFLVHILKSDHDQSHFWIKNQALGSLMKIDPKAAKPFLDQWKTSLTNADTSINPPLMRINPTGSRISR